MRTTKDPAQIRRRQTDAGIVMLGLLALDLPPVAWTVDDGTQRLEGLAMAFHGDDNDAAIVKAWAAHFGVTPTWSDLIGSKGGHVKAVAAISGVPVEVWALLGERPEGVEDAK